MATLIDDGTMDTVIKCDHCGQETRFTFDGVESDDAERNTAPRLYDAFVDECLQDVDNDCAYCADDN